MGFNEGRRLKGLYAAEVLHNKQVTPHMVRLTLTGDDLRRLPQRGFDQWFRLFLPRPGGVATNFDVVPEKLGTIDYLKYVRHADRPPLRNYTVREHRPELGEIDVDFVAHGDDGIAGPWARGAQPGERVVLMDQGTGFDYAADASFHLLAGDESALPAILGILRDMPRDARGLAIIEIPDMADVQDVTAPEGVEVRWVARGDSGEQPGAPALAAVKAFTPEAPATLSAYLAGERTLPAEGRRHLVSLGVPKSRITFSGYWRIGKAQA
ncbi:NADPH-dependent ferric siderophore reductase [Nocardioides luteus]|uniref:Siderophore-interacting protein n=1 Tax=Nocardioides luteus TaxID=1844 RepID=A0ABQ5SYP1_9ACTN|nr:siderophore-interacting protein [Nocardioides luteus]MDR7312900.1 NADPH-dependent ferric siderophore reductase [Nocardioides luteus]GGR48322.1 siderophore-interacting protein [Nocardioides luteus]GLJ69155.1 siderophore-interacting protein [Nocardioides luteus]